MLALSASFGIVTRGLLPRWPALISVACAERFSGGSTGKPFQYLSPIETVLCALFLRDRALALSCRLSAFSCGAFVFRQKPLWLHKGRSRLYPAAVSLSFQASPLFNFQRSWLELLERPMQTLQDASYLTIPQRTYNTCVELSYVAAVLVADMAFLTGAACRVFESSGQGPAPCFCQPLVFLC